MKKLFAVILSCSSIVFGSESVSFDSTQSTVVKAAKDGENIKLTVSPVALEKNVKGTPQEALQYLNVEMGKALESQGGMIPGKLYFEKQADGDITASAVFSASLYSLSKVSISNDGDRHYATGKVFVKVTNARNDPQVEFLSVKNRKVPFGYDDVEVVIGNERVREAVSKWESKNSIQYCSAAASDFAEKHASVHELMHAQDFVSNPYSLLAVFAVGAPSEFKNIMSNDAPAGAKEFKLSAQKTTGLANSILVYLEARAVLVQAAFRTQYLMGIRDANQSSVASMVNKIIPMTGINYNDLVNMSDRDLTANAEFDEMVTQGAKIKNSGYRYMTAYAHLMGYRFHNNNLDSPVARANLVNGWRQGSSLYKYVVNAGQPVAEIQYESIIVKADEKKYVDNIYSSVPSSDFNKKLKDFEKLFKDYIQKKCKEENNVKQL